MNEIIIFGNAYQHDGVQQVIALLEYLRSKGVKVAVERDYLDYLTHGQGNNSGWKSFAPEEVPHADMALSLGGDGTFLEAVMWVSRQGMPILGINMGHLGYLTAGRVDEASQIIDDVLEGRYRIEERTMLQVTCDQVEISHPWALNEVAILRHDTSSMLDKSFKFLGHEMVDLVNELKKQEKKGHKVTFPSFNALQWLYVCTLDKERGSKLSGSVKEANDYLLKLLKKERTNQTIYEKAMTAIILNSPQYVKSLKEFTVYKEEMGRYYDTPRAGYSWRDYRIPTQVAAIEALQRLTPQDRQTIDEMRRWLLQEKRTQAWDTPLNSVDAVYAFLNGNSGELKPQAQTVLRIDGQPMELPKATAGIGYVKTAQPYGGEKIFTAEKTSERTSWGCVYAQFMQPMTDIAKSGRGITVKRELLTNDDLSPLKVGQRITVRITIDCERDLDFVQVQDKRAACMEPVSQLSGYRNGCYRTPLDNCTNYFFDRMAKGRHVVETEYYIDRSGIYETGTCTVQCAYASEYRGTAPSIVLTVEK